MGVASCCVATRHHRLEVAKRTTRDINVIGNEVGARLRQCEGDGFSAGDHAGAAAIDRNGRCRGVGHQGIEAQADLVVGFKGHAGRCRVNEGICVVVAGHVGEHAGLDAHGGRAGAVGSRCEDRGVLGIATTGVAAGHYRCEPAEGTALHVNVRQCEGGAGFTQGEVDGFAGGNHAGSRTADDDGRCRGVRQRGVVVDVDDVVGFDHGAGHATNICVEVGIVSRISELTGLHANTCQTRAIGARRKCCGVVSVTMCGITTGEHWCKVAERATDDVDIG